MAYNAIKIGSRLQELRKSKNISQVKMAEMRGLSQSLLSKQESGAVSVDGESLAWYADFYGVTVDYILCRTDVPNIFVTTNTDQADTTFYTTEKSLSLQEQKQAEKTIDYALNDGEAEVSPALQRAIEQTLRRLLEEQGKQA